MKLALNIGTWLRNVSKKTIPSETWILPAEGYLLDLIQEMLAPNNLLPLSKAESISFLHHSQIFQREECELQLISGGENRKLCRYKKLKKKSLVWCLRIGRETRRDLWVLIPHLRHQAHWVTLGQSHSLHPRKQAMVKPLLKNLAKLTAGTCPDGSQKLTRRHIWSSIKSEIRAVPSESINSSAVSFSQPREERWWKKGIEELFGRGRKIREVLSKQSSVSSWKLFGGLIWARW